MLQRRIWALAFAALLLAPSTGCGSEPEPGTGPDAGVPKPGSISTLFRICLEAHDIPLDGIGSVRELAEHAAVAKVRCEPSDGDLAAYGELVGAGLR